MTKSDERKMAPLVSPGYINVQLTNGDLETLVALLKISRELFSTIALDALDQKNEQVAVSYTTSAKLAQSFMNTFNSFADIGEPPSGEIN